jgi:hypothetical protein
MNKRTTRNIILIIIILLLLAAVIYFLLMYKFPGTVIPKPANNSTTGQTSQTKETQLPATVSSTVPVKQANIPPPTSDAITQTNLEKTASSFAERLGSYSNQSNFVNISDLKALMTPSMQAWANKTIANNQKAAYSGIYQGMLTKAVSVDTKNFDNAGGRADMLVHTQRISTIGTSSPVTTYQDIAITFVKQDGNWLVDNAVWKK